MALVHTDLLTEIMQTDYSWYNVTDDVADLTCSEMGFSDDPASPITYPTVGKLNFVLRYHGGLYMPSQNGISNGKLDRMRKARLRVAGPTSGRCLQMILNGDAGIGATVDTGAGSTSAPLGATGLMAAQSILITQAGQLSQVTISAAVSGGGAGLFTAALPVSIYSDDASKNGRLGTLLGSGTLTSANVAGFRTCTATITGGAYLVPNQTVWVVVTLTNPWTIGTHGITNAYANGYLQLSTDSGVTWAQDPNFADGQVTLTTTSKTLYWSQVVSTATAISDVWTLQWDARAQFDSFYNLDSVRIVTSGETGSPTYYTYTNEWVTYTLTFTATATGTTIEPRFAPQMLGTGVNGHAVEYRNITLKKGAGSNVLTNGNLSSGVISPWAATNAGGSTIALSVIYDYWIAFYGNISTIMSANPLKYGGSDLQIGCEDQVAQVRKESFTTALQKNKRSDELAAVAIATLASSTPDVCRPGSLLATGKSTFPIAYDGYTQKKTSVLEGINDAVRSELARFIIKRCGTYWVWNRDTLPQQALSTPKLSLADGVAGYDLAIRHGHKVRNKITVTAHDRATGAVATTLGKSDQINLRVNRNVPITVTIIFKDSAGNTIGGDNVISPVLGVDIISNGYLPDSGLSVDNTAKLTLSNIVIEASQITMTISTSDERAFLTTLQVRGQTVTTYNPTTLTFEDATSKTRYQEQPYSLDVPFNVDIPMLTSYGNYQLSQFKYPFAEAWYFEAKGTAQIAGVDLLGLEFGDVVSVSNSKWGMTNIKHMITRIEFDMNPESGSADPLRYRAYLERLDQQTYWQLGVAGFSELGQTTILYL